MPRRLLLALGCCLLALLLAPSVAAALPVEQPATVIVQAQPDKPDKPTKPGDNKRDRDGDRAGNGDAVGPGPNLGRQEQEADANLSQNKAIIGAVAALLLVIVFFGRRSRNRYRRKVKNLKNAKA